MNTELQNAIAALEHAREEVKRLEKELSDARTAENARRVEMNDQKIVGGAVCLTIGQWKALAEHMMQESFYSWRECSKLEEAMRCVLLGALHGCAAQLPQGTGFGIRSHMDSAMARERAKGRDYSHAFVPVGNEPAHG